MANQLPTLTWIAYETLSLFKNSLGFIRMMNTSYSKEYARKPMPVGSTIQIPKPVRYVGRTGAALSLEDTVQTTVPLTISTQRGVDMGFTSLEMALFTRDDFRRNYIEPAVAVLANQVDADALQLFKAIPNSVGTPGTMPTTVTPFLQAGALLSSNGAPMDVSRRSIVIDPFTDASVVDSLKGYYNDQGELSNQYLKGRMRRAAGFNWFEDQNVATFAVGPQGGTPAVNGANQLGSSLITNGWTAAAALRLKRGDQFTIAGVFAVNYMSKASTRQLQQFVVTADTSSDGTGAATIPIYPAIVTTGATQTVTNSPANGAAITVIGTANTLGVEGIAFDRDAFALVSVPLMEPKGVDMVMSVTDPDSGLSIRILSDYLPNTDQLVTRLDFVYGLGVLYPEWAVRIRG